MKKARAVMNSGFLPHICDRAVYIGCATVDASRKDVLVQTAFGDVPLRADVMALQEIQSHRYLSKPGDWDSPAAKPLTTLRPRRT